MFRFFIWWRRQADNLFAPGPNEMITDSASHIFIIVFEEEGTGTAKSLDGKESVLYS